MVICGIGASLLLVCQLSRHYAFETPAYDLRIHEELVANTLRGRLLYSDLLGSSFLSHHVSLIFLLFAPLYALWPSPVFLLILQGVLVGFAGWWLWKLSHANELRPMIVLALVASFFLFKGLQSGYFRGFQQEVLGMCFAIAFLGATQAKNAVVAAVSGFLTLSCREDFALFLLGTGLVLLCRKERRMFGLATVTASLAWLVLSYGVVIPMYSPSGRMAAGERWSQYGSQPMEIVSGWVTHPLSVLQAVANKGASSHLRRLLFLPLADPATLLTIGIPWIIYTTSSFCQQASLGGAYASMFAAFLFAGAIRTLAYQRVRSLIKRDLIALLLFALLIGANVRPCPFPKTMTGVSSAHAALAHLNGTICGKRVLAQGCIIPHLGRPLLCDMLGSPRATAESDYDIVLISVTRDPWPLDKSALEQLADSLAQSSLWQQETHGCLQVFHRRVEPIEKEDPNQSG